MAAYYVIVALICCIGVGIVDCKPKANTGDDDGSTSPFGRNWNGPLPGNIGGNVFPGFAGATPNNRPPQGPFPPFGVAPPVVSQASGQWGGGGAQLSQLPPFGGGSDLSTFGPAGFDSSGRPLPYNPFWQASSAQSSLAGLGGSQWNGDQQSLFRPGSNGFPGGGNGAPQPSPPFIPFPNPNTFAQPPPGSGSASGFVGDCPSPCSIDVQRCQSNCSPEPVKYDCFQCLRRSFDQCWRCFQTS